MKNVNQGHRQRLRERYLAVGLDSFKDHEVLELLLFQYIPYKDTNKIAHALIEHFGTIANVLNAKPEQLTAVDGIGEVTAFNLALLRDVWFRYNKSMLQSKPLNDMSDIVNYARQLLFASKDERMVVVFLDNSHYFMGIREYTSHNENVVMVSPRQVVMDAMELKASSVVMFHSHIKGKPTPSVDDDVFTERLFVTLTGINVVLVDHIVFGEDNSYYSYLEHGRFDGMMEKFLDVNANRKQQPHDK